VIVKGFWTLAMGVWGSGLVFRSADMLWWGRKWPSHSLLNFQPDTAFLASPPTTRLLDQLLYYEYLILHSSCIQ
jgi:hypothetical protein